MAAAGLCDNADNAIVMVLSITRRPQPASPHPHSPGAELRTHSVFFKESLESTQALMPWQHDTCSR